MIKRKKEVLIYTGLFMVLSVMMAAVFNFRGRSFIHTADPFDQDYPIFLYLGRCLRDVIRGKGIHLYDFSVGLGENIIAPLNLYGFGDPLNLLSVFANESNAEFLYTVLLFARLYLAGISMIAFLKHYNHQGLLTAGGGILYAFSMFSITRGFHFYSLMNAMYLFPFLLIQLEVMISRKKQYAAYAKFALLIAVQACCSFYFLYMQTIFMVVYGFIYYCKINGKVINWRDLISKIGEAGVFYLLGVFTSGAILFPVLREFFHSSRAAGGFMQNSRLIFSVKELLVSFSNLLVPMISADNYGLALPFLCLMALIIYLLSSKYYWKDKLIACALIAAYICPLFWSITNGFSYESDRWTYILYFGASYVTIVVLEEYVKNGIPRRYIIIAALAALFSVSVHFVLNMDKIRCAAYFLAILGCTAVLIKCRLKEKHLLILLFGCVSINIFFLVAPWQVCGHDIWKRYCDKESVSDLNARMESVDADADFGRIEMKAVSRADSLVADYMGTTEYFSILNENIYAFWEQLLISPGICAEPHHLEGLDGRAPLEALLGVIKYQNGNLIVDNEYALPIGVQYTDAVSYTQFSEMSPLQRQHVLMEKVVLEEGVEEETGIEWEPLELDFEIEWENFNSGNGFFVPEDNACITLKVNNEKINQRKGELYVYFSDFRCLEEDFAAINVGEHELLVQNVESKYFTGLKDYLVHVNPTETGDVVISFPKGNQYELKDISVFWYDYEGMEEAVETLRENSLQNVEIKNDKVSGNIEAQNGWLFFSIPYSSDWEARVDGQKVDIFRANVGFMAIYLEEGGHFVELEYKPTWFKVGMICTVMGLLIIGGLLVLKKRGGMEKSTGQGRIDVNG